MSALTCVRLPVRAAGRALAAVIVLLALVVAARAGREDAPLPVLGRVADFELIDQTRAKVSRATLAGEPWVASFLFTRCTTVCPRLAERLRTIQKLAHQADDALLVTFSVDPEHDQPDVLRSYADGFDADSARWRFLTGAETSIEEIARSFAAPVSRDASAAAPDLGIMHSGHLILVDREGRIRGYYPSGEDGIERRILADLERLRAS
jgi:protein SCO1/2